MTDPANITTETYRLTPATYFRIAAGAKLPTLLATAALTALASAAAAVAIDLRILLVALIVLFLILPFAIAHIYYSELLTKDARYALMSKKVVIIPGCSISEIFSPDSGEDTLEEEIQTIPDRHFGWDEIHSVRRTSKNLILSVGERGYDLVIPLKTIPENSIKKICGIGEVAKNY